MMTNYNIDDLILDSELKGHFEGHSGKERPPNHVLSVTICPELDVTTCPDTVSLAKHAIAKNALQILFNGLCKIYNTILITISINNKAK